MKTRLNHEIAFAVIALLLFTSITIKDSQADDGKLIERGRYLVNQAGCNDCHSPGYAFSDGATPEDNWLTGDALGWRGPWGTSYASNLRLIVPKLTEEQWMDYAKNLKTRPPMPWYNLRRMKDRDLRAIYAFISHLGPKGEPAPEFVPPGEEPKTPFVLFPSPPEEK
jgi:mono/diheme cytochrome c family protein